MSGGKTPRPQAVSEVSAGTAERRQTVIAWIATLGAFLFGYDTGVISGALLYIQRDLRLTAASSGLVVSSILVGAAFGATFGGRLADRFGRKRLIRAAAVVFLVGTLGSASAPTGGALMGARLVLGLAVGAVSAIVPIYIGEIASGRRRGRLVNQYELMIVIGELVAFIVNAVMIHLISGNVTWRWMIGVAAIPAVLLLIGMSFVPETPRWFAGHGRYADAKHVLEEIRAPQDVASELDGIREVAEDQRHASGGRHAWSYLRARWIRVLFAIGVGIAICQQITGVNTIVYYAPTILQSTGLGASASVTASIAIGAVGVLSVIAGMVLVGRVNRRPHLITGLTGTTSSLLVLALLFLLPTSTVRSYAILIVMLVFIVFQQSSVSVVTWLLLSAIFPLRIRGFAMGVSVFMLWVADFAISLLFPVVNAAVGPTWTFLGFVVLGVGAVAFVTKSVPETRGHSLEALEKEFRVRYSGSAGEPMTRDASSPHLAEPGA